MNYYVLSRRCGTEKIQIQSLTGVVSSNNEFSQTRNDWTYVDDIRFATLFDSAILAELAREKYTRFSWIIFRPVSVHELESLELHGRLTPAETGKSVL